MSVAEESMPSLLALTFEKTIPTVIGDFARDNITCRSERQLQRSLWKQLCY